MNITPGSLFYFALVLDAQGKRLWTKYFDDAVACDDYVISLAKEKTQYLNRQFHSCSCRVTPDGLALESAMNTRFVLY